MILRINSWLFSTEPWHSFDYEPFDEEAFIKVIKKAHGFGMKVIAYMSPFYSMDQGDEYLNKVRDKVAKYDLDGVYFDGNSFDIMESYERIKKVRKILGDKLLYVHCTSDPINPYIYCPFIDTYADYILRSEWVNDFSYDYLRYVISGFNISNAIGHFCYSGKEDEFVLRSIDKILEANVRCYLPSVYSETANYLKKEYYPKLFELRNKFSDNE